MDRKVILAGTKTKHMAQDSKISCREIILEQRGKQQNHAPLPNVTTSLVNCMVSEFTQLPFHCTVQTKDIVVVSFATEPFGIPFLAGIGELF